MRVFVLMFFFMPIAAFGSNDTHVKSCLRHWKKTPFDSSNPNYRTISTSVNVFGAGKDIEDTKRTKSPDLVFLKPSVNVLGKSTIKLLNPNGWYCLKSNTNVLGKAVIELHCKAKLAISNTGATVLGSEEGDSQGSTTVLGKTKIRRVGCK